jgi:hypothetical protein
MTNRWYSLQCQTYQARNKRHFPMKSQLKDIHNHKHACFCTSLEVFTVAGLRSLFFCDITPCHWATGSQHFEESIFL